MKYIAVLACLCFGLAGYTHLIEGPWLLVKFIAGFGLAMASAFALELISTKSFQAGWCVHLPFLAAVTVWMTVSANQYNVMLFIYGILACVSTLYLQIRRVEKLRQAITNNQTNGEMHAVRS